MQKTLLFSLWGLLFSVQAIAQVKGNPVFNGQPQTQKIKKVSSVLSPDLLQLSNATTGGRLGEQPDPQINNALKKYMPIAGAEILVDITVKQPMAVAKPALQQLGLRITGEYGRMVSGYIPIKALPQLAAANTARFVRPAYKPMRHESTPLSASRTSYSPAATTGKKPVPVISQGDTAQRSYIARRQYKVTGKGVKVGILSDSYNRLMTAADGVLAGELPGPGNPFNDKTPVDVLQDQLNDNTTTDEGRAMAEIVHDVAPGAALAFHTAFAGEANFAQGIQDLANKGCKVIVDDIAYFDEPFFQDGIVCQSIDLAKKNGVTFFSAAGNNYNNSYESDFRGTSDEVLGPGNGTAHNFSAPGASARYYQPIYIPSGGSFIGSFQWDQPAFSAGGTGATSDLDIYLFDVNGNVVAAGAADNLLTGDPIEVFGFTNTTADYTFFLVIVKTAGPDPSHIKYNMYNDAQFYVVDNPSIPGIYAPTLVGHAKAAGAIAVAAASYLSSPAYGVDTPEVERFSSIAGVANYFDVAGNRIDPEYRKKPDLTGPDGGNTSFFNPFGNGDIPADADSYPNFYGTSASAPHVAGVAALMIDAEKKDNLTPDEIKGILQSHVIDMDNLYTSGFDKGFDLNTGYGFVKADEAVAAVAFPKSFIKDLDVKAVCSVDPSSTRSWKIVNPNPFNVQTEWFLLGTSQRGKILAPPGETVFSSNVLYAGRYNLPNIVILDWEDNFGFTRLSLENSSSSKCGNTSARTTNDASDAGTAEAKPLLADVFPNPSTAAFRVYLALADAQPVQLDLFSIDGKKLLTKQVSQPKSIVSIDAMGYKPGVYLLHISQGDFSKVIKVIKQ